MIATLFEHLRDWVFISSYYSHLINYSELLLSLCLLVLSVYGLFHQFKGLQIIWFSLLFLAYYLWGNVITQWSPKICSPRYPGRYLYLCCTWTSGNYIVSKCKLQFPLPKLHFLFFVWRKKPAIKTLMNQILILILM